MSAAIDAALALLDAKPLDYDVAKARALIVGYHNQWAGKYAGYDVVEVESEFRFPLLNPETETASRTFDEGGKIDLTLRHRASGRYVVVEHKTTSNDISPGSDYWDKLLMDTQCSKYILAQRAKGRDVGNLLYDVLHKPGSRPRQIPTLDADGVKIVVDAEGKRVRTKDGKKWRASADDKAGYVLQSVIETPEQYCTRLMEEIAAAPSLYFAQREVPRLDSDLLEYMGDAWAQSQEILMRRRMNSWARGNTDACLLFSKCEFYDLCTGRASVDGIRFRRAQKHRELSMEEGARELLTNSRSTCLRKCARLHFLRYEEPTEPCTEDTGARRFGSLIHSCFEAYFNVLKTKNL
jgi:hypothetical protein